MVQSVFFRGAVMQECAKTAHLKYGARKWATSGHCLSSSVINLET